MDIYRLLGREQIIWLVGHGHETSKTKDWRYVGESIKVDTRESVPGEFSSNQVDRITYSVNISPSPWHLMLEQ